MAKKITMSIVFCVMFFISNAYSVQFFYRFDTREPSILFDEGIPNLGENTDLMLHVEGLTCYGGERTSIFTSLTESENVAYEMANRFGGKPGRIIYVYRIRPDRHYYSVYHSLLYAFQQTEREIFRDMASNFKDDCEYVAFGGIESTNIHSVLEYKIIGDGNPIQLIGEMMNPDYNNIETIYNTTPFPFKHSNFSDNSSVCSSCISESSEPNVAADHGDTSINNIKRCQLLKIISLDL